MNIRTYGDPPFRVVVVHGGPGAPGEMKPVAKELSKSFGVLEPLQSADTIAGQIKELRAQIERNAKPPVDLLGYSWGAWLSYLLAAKYAKLVKKLILISSGPFEKNYAENIMDTRMNRLSVEEKKKVQIILKALQSRKSKDVVLKEFGMLMHKADSFDPINTFVEQTVFQPKIYEKIWGKANDLRSSGKLLEMGKNIECPVIAIHGDYDPHPAEGVREPLSRSLRNFRFIPLKYCGHTPWKEKKAKEKFYEIVKSEII